MKTKSLRAKPVLAGIPKMTFGEELIASLQEVLDALEAGGMDEVRKRFRVMDVRIPPKPFTAAEVAPLRKKIGSSHAAFADLLGVSPETVRSWERGEKKPARTARRFLEAIRSDPDYWRAKLAGPTATK